MGKSSIHFFNHERIELKDAELTYFITPNSITILLYLCCV